MTEETPILANILAKQKREQKQIADATTGLLQHYFSQHRSEKVSVFLFTSFLRK